jgi:nucleoside-diphosphate-sugar epimerase
MWCIGRGVKILILERPLVTGAGGFIGYHLCRYLESLPEVNQVIAVDLKQSINLSSLKSFKKIIVLETELGYENIENIANYRPTSAFALAALNGTSRFYEQPFRVLEASTIPTLALLSKLDVNCPILYSSSSEVYASNLALGLGQIPTGEDTPLTVEDIHNPRWSYGVAKIHGEMAVVSSAIQHKRKCAIVRYHNVYGPQMGLDHFIPDFIDRARRGIYQVQNPMATRSFLNINDAVRGTVMALGKASVDTPIFHLGNNEEMSILDSALRILKVMGIEHASIEQVEGPKGSVQRRLPSILKARKELDWSPQVTFEDGISEYLKGLSLINGQ